MWIYMYVYLCVYKMYVKSFIAKKQTQENSNINQMITVI